MSNLLTALLAQEHATREVAAAVAESIEAERLRMVKDLHDAFKPFADQVAGLFFKGDYGVPIQFKAQPSHRTKIMVPEGLHLILPTNITSESLHMSVVRREGSQAARYEFTIRRVRPYQSSEPVKFRADTSATHLVEHLLKSMLPYLHPNSLPPVRAANAQSWRP